VVAGEREKAKERDGVIWRGEEVVRRM